MSVVAINDSLIPDPVEVFLIAGQSNAAGTGTGAPTRSELLSPQGILYSGSIHATVFPVEPADTMVRLCALETTEGAINNRAHGIELNLAFQYNQYFSKTCIIMKETAGATSLAVDWADGSTLRNSLINRANLLTTYLTNLGRTWSIGGVYWNQWEGDAGAAVGQYSTNLENFVLDLRANITGFTTDVKFVACRPSTRSAFYNATIRNEVETASITNYAVLDQDDLFYIEPGATPVHCDSYSQNLLAERFLTELYPGITFI